MAILIGMMWYLIVTLVFISLMISDITLVIWLSSLKNYIFKSLDHFKIQVTSFFAIELEEFLMYFGSSSHY